MDSLDILQVLENGLKFYIVPSPLPQVVLMSRSWTYKFNINIMDYWYGI